MISIKLSAAMNAQLLHVIAIWSGSTAAGATFKAGSTQGWSQKCHMSFKRVI